MELLALWRPLWYFLESLCPHWLWLAVEVDLSLLLSDEVVWWYARKASDVTVLNGVMLLWDCDLLGVYCLWSLKKGEGCVIDQLRHSAYILSDKYLMFCIESLESPISSVSTDVSFLPIVFWGKLFSRQQAILDRQNTRQSKNQTLTWKICKEIVESTNLHQNTLRILSKILSTTRICFSTISG